MNLLDGKLYDPSTAVNKVTTAALAMTALDTTNLRLTVTVPPSGKIFWRVSGQLHGATTLPQIMLGVMEGATVRGRAAPMVGGSNLAATSLYKVESEGLITGLTPGNAITLDAAYGVETLVASTGLKYGGPNNTTANDNFGGLRFELWDPCPVYTPASGAAPTVAISARLDTLDDFVDTEVGAIKTVTDQLAFTAGRVNANVGAMEAGTITAAAIATAAIDADALAADAGAELADAVWDEAIAGHLTAGTTGEKLNAAGAAGDPWSTALPGAYGAGTAGKIVGDNLNATVSSRSSHSAADVWAVATRLLTAGTNIVLAKGTGVTGFTDLDAAGVRGAVGLAAANLDTQLGDLPTAAEIRTEMDANSVDLNAIGGLVTTIDSRVDVVLSTRLAAAGYTAPDNAGIAAIQAKTDSLNFTVAGKLDVNVLYVNGVQIIGTGVDGSDEWRRP